jgi:hypothetical protein
MRPLVHDNRPFQCEGVFLRDIPSGPSLPGNEVYPVRDAEETTNRTRGMLDSGLTAIATSQAPSASHCTPTVLEAGKKAKLETRTRQSIVAESRTSIRPLREKNQEKTAKSVCSNLVVIVKYSSRAMHPFEIVKEILDIEPPANVFVLSPFYSSRYALYRTGMCIRPRIGRSLLTICRNASKLNGTLEARLEPWRPLAGAVYGRNYTWFPLRMAILWPEALLSPPLLRHFSAVPLI